MACRLGLAQVCHPENGDVVSLVVKYARQAADERVDLLVFPESLMCRYEEKIAAFKKNAEPLDGEFSRAMDNIAAHYGLWLVYTMNERNDSHPDAKPFNTAVVVDPLGIRRGVYRKVHLFDTDFTQESSRMSAGDKPFDPIKTPFGKLGLAICYDLRFPEVARSAAKAGCDIMLYPSAWVSGPCKELQWKTLLASRAIENQMFVAGVSRADEGYIGCSCAFGPDGVVLAQADDKERLLVFELDVSSLGDFRQKMPIIQHLRGDLD